MNLNIKNILEAGEGISVEFKKATDKLPEKHFSNIAQIFTLMGRSEELGTGIMNVYKYSKAYSGSDKIVFNEFDVFRVEIPVLNFKSNGESNGELSNRQKLVYNKIREHPNINATELALTLNIPFSTIDKYIRFLLKHEQIKRVGSKKTGSYCITETNLQNHEINLKQSKE